MVEKPTLAPIKFNIPSLIRDNNYMMLAKATTEIAGVSVTQYYVHVYNIKDGSDYWVKEGVATIWIYPNTAAIGTHAGIAMEKSYVRDIKDTAKYHEGHAFPFSKDVRTVITEGKNYVGITWKMSYPYPQINTVTPIGTERVFPGFWEAMEKIDMQMLSKKVAELRAKMDREHNRIAKRMMINLAKEAVKNRTNLEMWIK